ncbi:MAG TPA: ATP-dependent DNA helicase RecG, partial [Gaiellaceae bacterium]|nr:ATP-dependent DNA helicase RecG [Gaiellaceae bacterium]
PRPRGWARPEQLDLPLDTLTAVYPALAKKLRPLGLRTIEDILYRRPRRYERAAEEIAISELWGEEEVAIAGVVKSIRLRRIRRRMSIVTAVVADATGQLSVNWFNQPWLANKVQAGTYVRLRGKLGRYGFEVKAYDLGEARATADFAPVYRASEEVPSARLREIARGALALHAVDVLDPLPAEEELPIRRDALHAVHFPSDLEEAETGRRRLALDELVALQLAVARSRSDRAVGTPLPPPGELVARYRAALPFELTEHQEHALAEIDRDLAGEQPMQRLLQGDVGSGKTVVALYALLRAVEAGRQGALMVPTETLAEQHFVTVGAICESLGVRAVLLTGSSGTKKGRAELELGSAQIAVGTHALIQRGVVFADLAVAVVDEQHRFGVEQRQALSELHPHLLHMTATPIPRSLALTVFGELDVTEIAKPPASRKPIITRWVEAGLSGKAYERLRVHLDAGRQAYVVCPLIEASETTLARAAEEEAARLERAELRGYRVGLLHGRLKSADRREVMRDFAEGRLDVLVATTVIEVGVDVPNATIMIVQEADRFGLAQLHQLRGRVGRGAEQSYCLLISRSKLELTDAAQARLEALVETTDGFELAERDLELRGEGQLLGTRQSGVGDLRFTRLRSDRDLLERARDLAVKLVEEEGPWHDEADAILAGADPANLA